MAKNRRWATISVLAVSFLLAAALAGCSGTTGGTSGGTTGGGATGGKVVVSEKDYKFNPAQITANVGDEVVFENQDAVPHHVVVGTADLGVQSPGQSVTYKAAANGTLAVKCLIHPTMVGQLTVGSGGGGSQSAPPAQQTPPAGTGSGY